MEPPQCTLTVTHQLLFMNGGLMKHGWRHDQFFLSDAQRLTGTPSIFKFGNSARYQSRMVLIMNERTIMLPPLNLRQKCAIEP